MRIQSVGTLGKGVKERGNIRFLQGGLRDTWAWKQGVDYLLFITLKAVRFCT